MGIPPTIITMNLADERKLALGTMWELTDLALQAVRDEHLTLADEHIDAAISHGALRSDAVIGRNPTLLEQA